MKESEAIYGAGCCNTKEWLLKMLFLWSHVAKGSLCLVDAILFFIYFYYKLVD